VGNAKDRAGGIDGLKNRSGKCEGPGGGGGGQRGKELEWEMRRIEVEGGNQRLFEKKSFFKKPKTSIKHC
jgi:hypothetical protein